MNECGVETLHRNLLNCWNNRDASGFALLFRDDGSLVGFDGTMVQSAALIKDHLAEIFDNHQPPTYVAKVREICPLGPDAAVLTSVAGMLPPGQFRIDPHLNATQVLVAARRGGEWRIVHFQSTPARFDGRPEEAEALTAELQAIFVG
ncbi:MAG: hypothetical protein QOE09_1493 [Ilumatobacteraceae bacterium]|jgi:uncharacterized protein (TIGR02246 family)